MTDSTEISLTSFTGFWGSVTRRIPGVLMRAANAAVAVIGVLLVIVALINRELSRELASWEGFSPWWALLPFGLTAAYLLARAIHDEFNELERTQQPDELPGGPVLFRTSGAAQLDVRDLASSGPIAGVSEAAGASAASFEGVTVDVTQSGAGPPLPPMDDATLTDECDRLVADLDTGFAGVQRERLMEVFEARFRSRACFLYLHLRSRDLITDEDVRRGCRSPMISVPPEVRSRLIAAAETLRAGEG